MFNKFKKRIYKTNVFKHNLCTDNGIDVLFIVDVTSSMDLVLDDLKGALTPGSPNNYVDTIVSESLGDYRLSLIEFRDTYTTLVTQTSNLTTFETAINGLTASGGSGIRDAYQNVIIHVTDDPSVYFRTASSTAKYIILITDAPPWGESSPGVYSESEPYSPIPPNRRYMTELGTALYSESPIEVISVSVFNGSLTTSENEERNFALFDLSQATGGTDFIITDPTDASQGVTDRIKTLCDET